MPEQDPQPRPDTRPQWKRTLGDILMGGVDLVTGGLGLPVGPDSKTRQFGELLAAAFPVIGGAKALAGAAAKKGIRAFHASPHDFDQFSLSKIGTGEGAQAYGHGLYFAESPKTAKAYWDQFEGRNFSDPEKVAVAAAKALEPLADGSILFGGRMWSPDKWVEAFKTGELTGHKLPPGVRDRVEKALLPKTYEVSINADPEDFLDWDAPLSQQSEKVRQAIGTLDPERIEMIKNKSFDITGRKFHDDLGGSAASRYGELKPSEVLKARGIPGIKYLDGASRSAGQGSRNYVVFDDQLISIVKKYGVAGALSAGLINQAQAELANSKGFQ